MAVAQVLARFRWESLRVAGGSCAGRARGATVPRARARVAGAAGHAAGVTVRLMLLQVLLGNTAITHLCRLGGLDFAASSFFEARRRLPLLVWRELVQWVARLAADAADGVRAVCFVSPHIPPPRRPRAPRGF